MSVRTSGSLILLPFLGLFCFLLICLLQLPCGKSREISKSNSRRVTATRKIFIEKGNGSCFNLLYFVCCILLLALRSMFFSNERHKVPGIYMGREVGRNWEE